MSKQVKWSHDSENSKTIHVAQNVSKGNKEWQAALAHQEWLKCPDLTQFVQQEYASALGSTTGLHDPSDACNEPHAVKKCILCMSAQTELMGTSALGGFCTAWPGEIALTTFQHKTHQGYA